MRIIGIGRNVHLRSFSELCLTALIPAPGVEGAIASGAVEADVMFDRGHSGRGELFRSIKGRAGRRSWMDLTPYIFHRRIGGDDLMGE